MNACFGDYLSYLSGVRRVSPRTVEGYRRDLELFSRLVPGSPPESDAQAIRLFVAGLGAEEMPPLPRPPLLHRYGEHVHAARGDEPRARRVVQEHGLVATGRALGAFVRQELEEVRHLAC